MTAQDGSRDDKAALLQQLKIDRDGDRVAAPRQRPLKWFLLASIVYMLLGMGLVGLAARKQRG